MKPALFVFADDHGSNCVYVHKCDDDLAYDMITRTVTHEWAPSLEQFDPSEYTALFVVANKKAPFDMIVTGEFDEASDDYADVEAVYEIGKTRDGKAIRVLAVSNEQSTAIWELRKMVLH